MKTIKLNNEISIDLSKLIDTRLLIQANSGAGKSWAIRRILEQSHGKVQQIVIDLEGEFGTLREKYDYILAGKGGDTAATPQSASLLARKLLELNYSAIIDLYELPHQDRKRFVRLFLEAMINAPKELWHPVMVIIDEAHVFVPEKGESEAAGAVIDLATRGRKRGFCAVLATQRISKLHKDAAAECNNKLIGRSSQDIDMKRAADELGFTSRQDQLDLRNLQPGEFYGFGPAISPVVTKLQIGEITTSHPKAGSRALTAVAKPTAAIKKILAKLADLPAEAAEEAKTVSELKTEIQRLKRGPSPQSHEVVRKALDASISRSIQKRDAEWEKVVKSWKMYADDLGRILDKIKTSAGSVINIGIPLIAPLKASSVGQPFRLPPMRNLSTAPLPPHTITPGAVSRIIDPDDMVPVGEAKFGKGERIVLTAIAQHEEGVTREQITVLTGYKRSTRDAYVQRLYQAELIEFSPQADRIMATSSGVEKLGSDFRPLPTGNELRDHLMVTLPEGEKKILEFLIENYPEFVDRDIISERTGYQRSTRDAYIQRLSARQLVLANRGGVKASDKLFN